MKFIQIIFVSSLILLVSGCSQLSSSTTHDTDMSEDHAMTVITSDKEFLQEMIPHHQEAVDSSRQLLTKTENDKLIAFLNGVVSLQESEIAQMKTWHKEWFATDYNPSSSTYTKMMSDYTNMDTTAAEDLYIKEMIGHHLTAIKMSNQLLALDPRQALSDFAINIISAQSDEVELLRNF
jgi:uncharacterized protein (DUF305 family)